MIIFLLILICCILSYLAIVGAVTFDVLCKIRAYVEIIMRRKAEEFAEDFVKLGYDLVKRDE